jgi:hypothetical protein
MIAHDLAQWRDRLYRVVAQSFDVGLEQELFGLVAHRRCTERDVRAIVVAVVREVSPRVLRDMRGCPRRYAHRCGCRRGNGRSLWKYAVFASGKLALLIRPAHAHGAAEHFDRRLVRDLRAGKYRTEDLDYDALTRDAKPSGPILDDVEPRAATH